MNVLGGRLTTEGQRWHRRAAPGVRSPHPGPGTPSFGGVGDVSPGRMFEPADPQVSGGPAVTLVPGSGAGRLG